MTKGDHIKFKIGDDTFECRVRDSSEDRVVLRFWVNETIDAMAVLRANGEHTIPPILVDALLPALTILLAQGDVKTKVPFGAPRPKSVASKAVRDALDLVLIRIGIVKKSFFGS